jgi:hypothetical protein
MSVKKFNPYFTNAFLYERMKTESIEEILKPLDKYGKIINIKDYSDPIERKKISLWPGHMMERTAEFLFILKCCKQFEKFKVYQGKIGKETELKYFKDYAKDGINQGNNGGVVDIFMKEHFDEGDVLHCWTSKHFEKIKSVKKHDAQDIDYVIKNAIEDKRIDICSYKIYLLVRNKEIFYKKLKKSTGEIGEIIKNKLNIRYFVYDINDLKHWLSVFKLKYANIHITDIKLFDKVMIRYHLHQFIIANQLVFDYNQYKQKVFGLFCVCRSGKSFIMAGIIDLFSKQTKDLSVLIITSRPSETMGEFLKMFKDYEEFDNFDVEHINTDFVIKESKNHDQNNQKIHLVSKQYIQQPNRKHNLKYDIIMFDEAHEGGCSLISQDILKKYSTENTIKIFITATFNKPRLTYKIPDQFSYFWNLDDIENMKNEKYNCLERFTWLKSTSKDYLESLCGEDITEYYKSFPKLCIFTNEFIKNEKNSKEIALYSNNEIGFDFLTLFLLNKKKKFRHPNHVNSFMKCLTGQGADVNKRDKKNCIFERIKKHKETGNEFIGMIWFLPYFIDNHIYDIAKELRDSYILKDPILKDYEVVITKEIKGKNLKDDLDRKAEIAKRQGKKGIILLTAKQCALGVSLKFIDIVCLFNSFMSADIIYQMIFRSMTESKDKKFGYVIDFNPNRVVQSINSLNIKGNNIKDSCLTEIIGNIIDIDPDYFQQKERTQELIDHFLKLYNATFINITHTQRLRMFIKDLEFEIPDNLRTIHMNEDRLDIKETGLELKKTKTGVKKEVKERIENEFNKKEVKEKNKEIKEQSDKLTEEEKRKLLNEIIYYTINLYIVLNINSNKYINHIIDDIMSDKKISDSITSKVQSAFNTKIPLSDINKIITKNSNQVDNYIDQTQKELVSIKGSKKEVLNFITKLLNPRESEKKEFGEVFTPLKTIETMLDILETKYPKIFKTKKFKWLDPTNGIGNFSVCIYYRLLNGLKDKIKDDDERKKHILENMLYVCELNPGNMEIYKQLMCSDDYQLNYHTGDFLELNINKEWDFEKFDIIIGNPPYSIDTDGSKKSASPYYTKFVNKSDKLSKKIFMLTPSRWFGSNQQSLNVKFRNQMFKRSDVKLIQHYENEKEIFNEKIDGGVSFLLIDHDYDGECEFIKCKDDKLTIKMLDLSKLEMISDSNYDTLKDKLFENKEMKSLVSIWRASSYYVVRTNVEGKSKQSSEYNIKCYVNQEVGFIKYINLKGILEEKYGNNSEKKYKEIMKKSQKWKVITVGFNGDNKSFGNNMFIGSPNEIHTNTYLSFEVDTEEEAKSLFSYMKCKFTNVMLGLRKSGRSIIGNTCEWIPLVPLDREWTDDKVHKYFKLTDDEIKLIDDFASNNKMSNSKNKKGKKERKDLIIFDEIKAMIDGEEENINADYFKKLTVVNIKQICDNNKISRVGCKVKQDYINCIMGSTEKVKIS